MKTAYLKAAEVIDLKKGISFNIGLPGEIHITGTVVDELGNVLSGVTVVLKSSQYVTLTDDNGRFSLDASPSDTLSFSYIGYETRTISVANRTDIRVVLTANEGSLNEVVVVAFGEQKKESVTGSMASIGTKELKQSPSSNLMTSLTGRLPGLTVVQRGAEPGAIQRNLNFYIRGMSTVNARNPIILVDGIERDIDYIDPNEVETISILKDASSTALYGVRGANGVILVTTKRGTSEKPRIDFSAEYGAERFSRRVHPVNSYQYALLKNLELENDGLSAQFSPSDIEHFRIQDDPIHYPNTDWYDIMLKDFSLQQRYNLNVSGAGEKFRYFVNAGYLSKGGQFKVEKDLPYDPSFKADRYNFRSNIDVQLNKGLHGYLNLAGYVEKQNMTRNRIEDGISSTSEVIHILASMVHSTPDIPGPLSPDGKLLGSSGNQVSAYARMNRSGYIALTTTSIISTFGLEQSLDFITEGLSIKVDGSFDTKAMNRFIAEKHFKMYEQIIDPIPGENRDTIYYRKLLSGEETPLSIKGQENYNQTSNFRGYLNYKRSFQKHEFTGLLLFQKEKTIIDHQLPFNLISLSTRLAYGYDNKYFLEFDAGYNGSEQFEQGHRFGFFPSISGAWILSREKFLNESPIVNHLKLRGSYGRVGNDRLGGSRFLYLDNLQIASGGNDNLGDNQIVRINSLGNRELTWETSRQLNLGIELGMFDLIDLNIDLFREKRNDILIRRGIVPVWSGLTSSMLPPSNIGIIVNRGIETELTLSKAVNSDFSFLTKLNFNYVKNKYLYADEPLLPEDYTYRYRQTGFSLEQQFGYLIEGYFGTEELINKSPKQVVGGHESRPGDFKYKDTNGDNVVDEKDVVPIGYPTIPEITLGMALNINYKGFDLSLLFQGVTNVSNFYQSWGVFPNGNYFERQLNSWTEERAINGEKITWPRLTNEPNPNQIRNSFFIVDASYLRLKNAELGYRFSSKICKRIGADEARVYVNGFNLLTFDRLATKDFDPEVTSGLTYPNTSIYNFGINLIF